MIRLLERWENQLYIWATIYLSIFKKNILKSFHVIPNLLLLIVRLNYILYIRYSASIQLTVFYINRGISNICIINKAKRIGYFGMQLCAIDVQNLRNPLAKFLIIIMNKTFWIYPGKYWQITTEPLAGNKTNLHVPYASNRCTFCILSFNVGK